MIVGRAEETNFRLIFQKQITKQSGAIKVRCWSCCIQAAASSTTSGSIMIFTGKMVHTLILSPLTQSQIKVSWSESDWRNLNHIWKPTCKGVWEGTLERALNIQHIHSHCPNTLRIC